jgi:hypothetical protein
MSLSDEMDKDLDREHERIVVLFNANDQPQTFSAAELAGHKLALHRVQRSSVDPLVKTSRFNRSTGAFTIPGRTTAVFVEYERPQVRIGHLIEDIQALVSEGVLNSGQGNALISKLEAAIQALDRGNPTAAVNQMNAFMNEVYALVRAGALTNDQGLSLIVKAKDIIWQIKAGV